MPSNVVNGFNVNGVSIPYNYDSLANKILKSSIGNEYSSLSTYKVDDYVLYAGQLYRCIVEVTTPQNFDSSKWEVVSAGSDLKWLKKYYSIDDEIKQALLNCFAHCAWVDEHGQDYYDALETALYRTADLDYITAVFNQGQNIIYDTDSLDTLKQYLTVTAYYDDGNSGIVTGYTLSGTLEVGTSTITVSYAGKTTTFTVNVTQSTTLYSLLNYTIAGEQIDTGVKLFETDRDFSLAIDIDITSNGTSGKGSIWRLFNALHLTDNERYGLTSGKGTSGANTLVSWFYNVFNVSTNFSSTQTGRLRYIITHSANSGIITSYVRVNNEANATISTVENAVFQSISETTKIGDTAGNNATNGIIHSAYIYSYVMTSEQINDYLGL